MSDWPFRNLETPRLKLRALEPGDAQGYLDVKLAKPVRLGGANLELALIVHNLTDENYVDFTNYHRSERRVYAQVTLHSF